MGEQYDVIVVGAGVEGSATAYHLAKAGRPTLLLEQFPLPNSRGSSHGHSRITRKAYNEDFYVRMMKESYTLWSELERETGTTLYRKTGLIAVGKCGGTFLSGVENALRRSEEPYESLSPDQFGSRYPMLSYPADYGAVYDEVGGILYADKAVAGFQKMFVEKGGDLRSGEKMTSVFPGQVVTVRTTKATYRARGLVICAGPWAPQLLKPLGITVPLQPLRITVCYWKEKAPGVHSADRSFPCVIEGGVPALKGFDIYGLPTDEYPGHFKLVLHTGPAIEPDSRDDADDAWVVELTSAYVRKHFPGLEGDTPSIKETCIYTVTPDKNFILDSHPHWKNIVIGAGFSGHGFKMAPVVGKVLAELALGKSPSYDLTPFSIDRFFKSSL